MYNLRILLARSATQKKDCCEQGRLLSCILVVDGGYSNWTLSSHCSVSCGEGIEIWQRTCDSPKPKYAGRNCHELGNSTESKKCSRKPCPSKGETLHLAPLNSDCCMYMFSPNTVLDNMASLYPNF